MTAGHGGHPQDPVAIVGAGLAGTLLAILLAERGLRVEVYERRADPRTGPAGEGRSVNLGVSARGIRALRRIGLWTSLSDLTVPMRGRVVHRPGGARLFQPYGRDPQEILHSIRRNELNARLVERAAAHPGIGLFFGARCVGLDPDQGLLSVTEAGLTRRVRASFVVGADGAFSTVRRLVQHGRPVDYRQEFLAWGYKELTIPPGAGGRSRVPPQALNLWPARQGLIVAHPNVDASHTATLFLPHRGEPGFTTLAGNETVTAFFTERFPGFAAIVPDLTEQYASRPVGHLVTVGTSAWHHRDRVVLVGDAAHAVYPFYGQGMNSSLEDCLVLDECLDRHPRDRAAAFADYQRRRKPHTDVLAALSAENFAELRDGTRSPLRLARSRIDHALHRLFPAAWAPLHTMVSHTTLPYGEALRRARHQDRMLRWAGATAVTAALTAAAVRGARKPPC
ncbi:FAD-dependent oxidoreductase [Planobispora siamensis]|uniref:Kynurenine 3-monooxygenase n=1 Tax=Planobispora siamensis TaxID=936338 RepID=A0A8J3SRS6_9ACTN|nr:NAD(P)/FAD-dependent oxidoreductase [Planobispora siamensis]GIH97686.1 kynurenine 3-monooxygenase [Planobispora siamensis]